MSLPVGELSKSHTPGAFRASYGSSYSDTDHYYIGKERSDLVESTVAPATLGVEHLFGLEYDLPHGITVVGEVPIVRTDQSREGGAAAGTMKAHGIGDLRLLARYWMASNAEGLRFSASLGVRLPTGKSDGKFLTKGGKTVTNDLAAQAGTGNLAGILEVGGGAKLSNRFGLGFAARYVFTPSATTVSNFRHELSGVGPEKNSDSDAATARVTLNTALNTGHGPWSRVALSILTDIAWVPYDDLIGDTEGFRRAGPILLAGPGLSWMATDRLNVATAVPITLYRDVQQNGGNVQDWTIQLSASYNITRGIDGR